MEDAGFIIGSYVVTFGGDRRLRLVRAAPRPGGSTSQLPDEAKPWT